MQKKFDSGFKSPEESPGFLLAQLTLLWQRKQKKVLDPLKLTHTQFVILASLSWLSQGRKDITQVEIANQANADRMMVSKVLRALEEKKFLVREEHEKDTRAKVVKLTSSGEKVLNLALKEVEKADEEFFSPLDKELSVFKDSMQRLIYSNNGR